ncbi:hypothetical protein [Methylocella sp.]|uniref:hypothetical protein n=1 Tax=Methylocella sp. TaxID=1978226 RepID=UPI003783CFAD
MSARRAPAFTALALAALATGAARAERLEKCPVDAADAALVSEAVRTAPSCAQAYEVLNACRANARSDLPLAQIVVERCEEVLNPTLVEPRFRAYVTARAACAKRFSTEKTEAALAHQSLCEAGVAVVFAQRADQDALRAARDQKRQRFMPQPKEFEPKFERRYPQALPDEPPPAPPPADPFGALSGKP